MRLGKFQFLAEVRISGEVVAVHGADFDLLPDWDLAAPWPWTGGVVHAESYGWGSHREEPGLVLEVGDRIAVSGVLALDNAVHAGEEPGRVVFRGPFRAGRPKLELHPYWASTIEYDPAPLQLGPVRVSYWSESYGGNWLWNRVAQIDDAPVIESFTTAELHIAPVAPWGPRG